MQSRNDANNSTKNKMMPRRDPDLQEYQQIKNDLYHELMDPNLAVQFLLFWMFVVLVIVIPLQVITDYIIKNTGPWELFQSSIKLEHLYFAIPLLCIVGIGYYNIKFLATFNDRVLLFEEMQATLKEAGIETRPIILTETQHYKLIIKIETTFIVGTFFVACLWFLSPEHGRLEPLTIIYGFGTAIFEYFRSKLKIPNPLDRFLAS